LYYLKARYYDPETGRFISEDDVSVLDKTMNTIGGLNLYAYCYNNPVMKVDPSGNKPFDWLKLLKFICIGISIIAITVGIMSMIIPMPGFDKFSTELLGFGIISLAAGFTFEEEGGTFVQGWSAASGKYFVKFVQDKFKEYKNRVKDAIDITKAENFWQVLAIIGLAILRHYSNILEDLADIGIALGELTAFAIRELKKNPSDSDSDSGSDLDLDFGLILA